MCNCGGGKKTSTVWTVTYPSPAGHTTQHASSVEAHMAAAKVPDAKVTSTTQ